MFNLKKKISRNRKINNCEINKDNNAPIDDENVFWMNIEDEYFNKIDERMKDILKFHIHSSEYILNTIDTNLSNIEEDDEYNSASLIINDGLKGWNRTDRNDHDGYGLFEDNDLSLNINDYNSFKNETCKLMYKDLDSNYNSKKRIMNINLTLNMPPLYKPLDFPKELNQCKTVKDILHNLLKIQCMSKYTTLNSNRMLYNINEIREDNINFEKENKTCNYICLVPDIISGPNTNWYIEKKDNEFIVQEGYYYNSINEEWIFNIDNKRENMILRKKLLDTSDLLCYKEYINNSYKSNIKSNITKSILGSGEYIINTEINHNQNLYNMNKNDLVSIIDDLNDSVNNIEDNTVNKIKRIRKFGDFFQDNINISPNIKLESNKDNYLNLSSIIDSYKKIDFIDETNNDYIYNSENLFGISKNYLNRKKSRDLRIISISLINRLRSISKKKIEIFKLLLDRVENEKQPNLNYWFKKEFELNNYYRRKQYDTGYNYTLERQSKDLELFRLACIESKYLPNEWQETALCSICGNDTDWDEDPIYFCDGCYQPAHHSCVNPRQPFKYNSTRMLNVIEREKRCQQGDFEDKKDQMNDDVDDDDQWLCDVCLSIKSQLLDHKYLFFLLIRMISGPRDTDIFNRLHRLVQKNVDPFLNQLINYNVLSKNINFKNDDDLILFPWIRQWKLPIIKEEEIIEDNIDSNSIVMVERRKGRPRKTPLLSLNTLKKSSYIYFSFEFHSIDNDFDDAFVFNEWMPSYQTPYNLADLNIFFRQIFTPTKWYELIENKKKVNQTPPPILISSSGEVKYDFDLAIDFEIYNKKNHEIIQIYNDDENIIKKLIEKKIIEYNSDLNKYKINIKVPICQLCGYDAYCRSGGIMKRTVDGYWSHIRCALSNNSILSSDGNYLRIRVDLQRNKIKCQGCEKIDCSPILCHNNECYKSFHINCASSRADCIVDWENSKPILYCPEHANDIAPTILLRKYQLSNFNKWFYNRFNRSTNNLNDNYYNRSIFGNIFNLPTIVRQTFLADLRDDTRAMIFLTKMLKEPFQIGNTIDNENDNSGKNINIRNKNMEKLKQNHSQMQFNTNQEYKNLNQDVIQCNQSEFNGRLQQNKSDSSILNVFSKFHLYLPELVSVQSTDTVISRLSTPWIGDTCFWFNCINNDTSILNSLSMSDIYNINQYRYLDNSKIIITSIFNIMELLLNRLVNPYEIRFITLAIAAKMGFGPWFSLFYYWKFIPLTFYYNIIKDLDLIYYEPHSLNLGQSFDQSFILDSKNVDYHLKLFGFKYLSIEKLNSNEACLKSINSSSTIISQNWNYCCQLCGVQYPVFNKKIHLFNNQNNFNFNNHLTQKYSYLFVCSICNVVVCSSCNDLYENNHIFGNVNQEITCERCSFFKQNQFINVITESCCCLCSRFDGLLLRMKKNTFIEFNGIKARKTLLADGSIPLDDRYRLVQDIWIHPICIEWFSFLRNQVYNLNSIVYIEKKYFNNNCQYCGFNTGATINCSFSKCNTYFHISCGRSIGCKFDYNKFKPKQYDQYNNHQYRRAWCIYHNQYNNNTGNNNNNININAGGINSNSNNNSQDMILLRTLYNNIIQNNNEIINKEEININRNININYTINQNHESLLKISLLNYYGFVLSNEYTKQIKGLSYQQKNPLFSKNIEIKNEINSCDQDIVYINKWEDLIQILVYDIISRFIYGIGIPRQKCFSSAFKSFNRKRNQNFFPKNIEFNSKFNANIVNEKALVSNEIHPNCKACDKLFKRDWSQIYQDWIFCDSCNSWYHWNCLGLNKNNIPKENEPFHCIFCLNNLKTGDTQKLSIDTEFNQGKDDMNNSSKLNSDLQLPSSPSMSSSSSLSTPSSALFDSNSSTSSINLPNKKRSRLKKKSQKRKIKKTI